MTERPEGYEVVEEVITFRDVAAAVKENPDLWVFCGTEGWHGTKLSLNECEQMIRGKHETWSAGGAFITVFLIDPKRVSIRWGEVSLKTINEAEWLRKKVDSTIQAVIASQSGNVSAKLFE